MPLENIRYAGQSRHNDPFERQVCAGAAPQGRPPWPTRSSKLWMCPGWCFCPWIPSIRWHCWPFSPALSLFGGAASLSWLSAKARLHPGLVPSLRRNTGEFGVLLLFCRLVKINVLCMCTCVRVYMAVKKYLPPFWLLCFLHVYHTQRCQFIKQIVISHRENPRKYKIHVYSFTW